MKVRKIIGALALVLAVTGAKNEGCGDGEAAAIPVSASVPPAKGSADAGEPASAVLDAGTPSDAGAECAPGHVLGPDGKGCVKAGDACNGVSKYGYCSSSKIWTRCDPESGVVVMNCGPPGCAEVPEYGFGACRCGEITGDGLCADGDGKPGNVAHWYCLTQLDVLVVDHCAESTKSKAGFCGTYVSSFGHQTTCFCSQCNYFDYSSKSCQPLCPGMQCSATGSVHSCS